MGLTKKLAAHYAAILNRPQSQRRTVMITVHIAGRAPVQVPDRSPARALLELCHLQSPHEGLICQREGQLIDWSTPLRDQDRLQLLNFDHALGRQVFWHTSAHVLAQAVLRLWPEAQPTIGPPIDAGFYYDFGNLALGEADLASIEREMEQICLEGHCPTRFEFDSRQEALDRFGQNPYKLALIESFETGQVLSGYRQGEFFDLCRGPHLPTLRKIRALKVLKTAGAYWRGNAANAMLTRIYAISFPASRNLKNHLELLQEAQRRDHKVLGPRLDLFSMREEAPGIPFIHPHGVRIWESLMAFWRASHRQDRYLEIKTPLLLSRELWEQSGHWDHYRQNMFTTTADERELALRPMNCPGAFLYFKLQSRSYRQLPLRVAEVGLVHRNEASGALSGLMRTRGFHQDDAHIFLTMEQVEGEIERLLQLMAQIYRAFDLTYRLELSTRPEGATIGTDDDWERATRALRQGLEKGGHPHRINEGDGAFYGPKIDVHVRDAIGRNWQCATVQLDLSQAERFDLTYTARDGSRKRPVILHRVIFGSIERFMGILIEHYAGRFPLWLSPLAVRLAPVADRHTPTARQLLDRLLERGFAADLDESGESISKKIRQAQLGQINYMLVLGDREVQTGELSVRARSGRTFTLGSWELFFQGLTEEMSSRSPHSHWERDDR